MATALGYSNTSKAIQQHVDEEDKGTLPIRESAYETRAIVINESGLYSLILSSKLEQARAFKHWVTSEVLPQVRQTGVMMQLFLHLNYVRACFRSA
ncbi:MAG: Bro-N domain-containing protein [Bacteroidaceae bacterium]|nr:Bro-N domain-containing protein [Bacteroidaceae bacterium]